MHLFNLRAHTHLRGVADVSGTPCHTPEPSSDLRCSYGGPQHGSSASSFTYSFLPWPMPSLFQISALKSPWHSGIPSAILNKGIQWLLGQCCGLPLFMRPASGGPHWAKALLAAAATSVMHPFAGVSSSFLSSLLLIPPSRLPCRDTSYPHVVAPASTGGTQTKTWGQD